MRVSNCLLVAVCLSAALLVFFYVYILCRCYASVRSLYFFVCLFPCVSFCLPLGISTSLYVSLFLSRPLFLSVSLFLSFFLFFFLYASFFFLCVSFFLYLSFFLYIYIYLFLSISLSLSLPLFLSVFFLLLYAHPFYLFSIPQRSRFVLKRWRRRRRSERGTKFNF